MSEVEEIKNRLNIADVISEYIQLTPAGTNFKARCPFHNEKTPSFMVSPDKQIWHCFGACDEGGDIFTFVQKMEGVEFVEALKILAEKAGVKLTPRAPREETLRNRLVEVCLWAAKFFHAALLHSQQGKIARDYLTQRKIIAASTRDFLLGYSPDAWELTTRFLRKKGFDDRELVQAGLALEKRGKVFDRFRGRLMFPINNVHGQVVGFGARVLDEKRDKLGKYINSPQTLIYDKSNILYALDRAKSEIKRNNLCIAVEGYLDVIASHSVGVRNVISVSGTALTPGQISLIKRYTPNLVLCFDADAAGLQAAKRGITSAIATGLNVRVVVLPKNEDPDSLIRQDPKKWRLALKGAQAIMDFYFQEALRAHNPETVSGKKMIAAQILPMIKTIPDKIEQAFYLQELAHMIKIEEGVLRESLDKISAWEPSPGKPEVWPEEDLEKPAQEVLGRRILGIGLKFPQFLGKILEEIEIPALPSAQQDIYRLLKAYYNEAGGFFLADFKSKIEASHPRLVSQLDVAILDVEKDFEGEVEEELLGAELDQDLQRLRDDFLRQNLRSLETQIQTAEQKGEKKKLHTLTAQFSALSHKLFPPAEK